MNIALLILSLLVYVSYGLGNLIFILFSMISTFISAKYMKSKHAKTILCTALALNIALLICTRLMPNTYFSMFSAFGISYYTLQVISYLVDVYKQKYDAETNVLYYALYIFYIPHLYIGPIIKYDDMKAQILKSKKITLENITNGAIRIVFGLAKKLIIADRISVVVTTISGNMNKYAGVFALFAMLLYSIEIYSDFSGGIDIVLGISKILGVDLKENFNSPYFSENIKEFWRRWHISLSTWLREYVYIPLGGNRCSSFRKAINILITFTISGLWHGVNYILWGILHGLFVAVGDIKTRFKWLNRIGTFIIVSFLWSFFIWSESLSSAGSMMVSVFTEFDFALFVQNILNLGLSIGDYIVLLVSTIALFVFDGNSNRIIAKIKALSFETKLIILGIFVLLILTFGTYGIGFNVSEFIYSKF